MMKLKMSLIALAIAVAIGGYFFLQPGEVQAWSVCGGPGTPPAAICDPVAFCNNLCNRYNDQCLANGGTEAQCAADEQFCLDSCLNFQIEF